MRKTAKSREIQRQRKKAFSGGEMAEQKEKRAPPPSRQETGRRFIMQRPREYAENQLPRKRKKPQRLKKGPQRESKMLFRYERRGE